MAYTEYQDMQKAIKGQAEAIKALQEAKTVAFIDRRKEVTYYFEDKVIFSVPVPKVILPDETPDSKYSSLIKEYEAVIAKLTEQLYAAVVANNGNKASVRKKKLRFWS